MDRIGEADTDSSAKIYVARDLLLSNGLHGYKILSSFVYGRGYAASIVGNTDQKIPADNQYGHKWQD